MQLYIQILLLFINPFFQEIDTTKLESFNIKGEKYSFGGYNEVFKLDGDSLKRIDNSVDSRVTINAYVFKLNDTVIKYGGYGFWSQRNFMYYFDTTSFEWEIYKINYEDNLEGSFSGYQNSTDESIIFYGGKKVNPKSLSIDKAQSAQSVEQLNTSKDIVSENNVSEDSISQDKVIEKVQDSKAVVTANEKVLLEMTTANEKSSIMLSHPESENMQQSISQMQSQYQQKMMWFLFHTSVDPNQLKKNFVIRNH